MIQVRPPKGWVAPVSASDLSSSSSSTANPFGGDFDDIEQILAKPPRSPRSNPANRAAAPGSRRQAQPGQVAGQVVGKRVVGQATPGNGPASRERARRPAPAQPETQATGQATGQTTADQPILPTDQWTSDATRKRRRLVGVLVGVFGTLILLGAVAVAVFLNQPDPDVVADGSNSDRPDPLAMAGPANPDIENQNPNGEQNLPDVDSNSPLAKSNNQDQEMLDENPLDQENPDAAQANDGRPVKTTETNLAPFIADATPIPNANLDQNGLPRPDDVDPNDPPANDDQVNIPDDGESPDNPSETPIASGTDQAKPLIEPQSPFSNDGPQIGVSPLKNLEPEKTEAAVGVGMVEKIGNELGDLSDLLQEQGTSITDIRDAAAATRDQPSIGMPKYAISHPDKIKLELEDKLAMPIGGVMYESAPLTQALRDISTISGIPITIDGDSMVTAGLSPNPSVTTKISDIDLNQTLSEMLGPLGLTHTTTPVGLSVHVPDSIELKQAEIELPNIPNLTDDSRARWIATIRALIDPESWVREENPATIELNGNKISVKTSDKTIRQITDLVSRMQAAYQLIGDPESANARDLIRSRWNAGANALAQNPAFTHSIRMEIGTFLNKLQAKTGVTVLVDWEHVVLENWTPQTIVPGNIIEPSVDETIRQLAQALKLTVRSIDPQTVVLTTFDQAMTVTDLEVYPVGNLMAGKLSQQQLLQLVNEALGAQVRSERVRYVYDEPCQCLIVSAPQSLQRQIEAMLDRLSGK